MLAPQASTSRVWRERLVNEASLEVTVRDRDAASVLREHVPAGARVHVTYLSNASYLETVAQAKALTDAGLTPVPHIAAGSFRSPTELEDYVSRLVGEAGATRALLVAGDLDPPRGPYVQSLDVLKTGVLEARGLRAIGFAAHPEGHPSVAAPVMARALTEKLAYAAAHGMEAEIVTQFCFEAAPIVTAIRDLRTAGVATLVRIGAAAPTNALRMMKFAMRCGVGPSVRALERQSARLGDVMINAGPEALVDDLALALAGEDLGAVGGMHFFVFGGVKQSAAWLQRWRASLQGGT